MPVSTPWTATNVGGAVPVGTANQVSGVFTLEGGGPDIEFSDNADGFEFVHQVLVGDGSITARITSLENTHAWAKCGVMMKQSTTKLAPFVLMGITPSNGSFAQTGTAASSGVAYTLPRWVRLTRTGNSVVCAYSANGTTWTTQATYTLPTGEVRVGLFVTSHTTATLATAVFDNVNVAGATPPPPQTTTVVVRAASGAQHTLTIPTPSVTGTPPPPPGTRQIDGGPTYYASNGHTFAAARGWDDPAFFPIGAWIPQMTSQSDADRWKDLGFNTGFLIVGGNNQAFQRMRDNGFSLILNEDVALAGPTNNFGTIGAETVGVLTADEPSGLNQMYDYIRRIPNSVSDGRFFWANLNMDRGGFYGTIEGQPPSQFLATQIPTPNGRLRHIDIASTDCYWFAGAESPEWQPSNGGAIYGVNRRLTADEMSHGHNYGITHPRIRAAQAGAFPAPQFAFIENGGPFLENTTLATYITPPEINAAVWGAIIQGARGVCYFNHSFAGPYQSIDNLAQTTYYRQVQSGQTESVYSQTKKTNALIKQLAPVINSPFADNVVTAVPLPGTFGTEPGFAGVSFMTKLYQGVYYVFALNRASNATTATFTVQGASNATVTVVNENRTVPLSAGKFTDTFTNRNTVHIYKIG